MEAQDKAKKGRKFGQVREGVTGRKGGDEKEGKQKCRSRRKKKGED